MVNFLVALFLIISSNYAIFAQKGYILPQLGHSGTITRITASNDGNFIFTSSEDNTIIIWDAKTLDQLNILGGHTAPVKSFLLTNRESYLVSKSEDNSFSVWNYSSGEEVTSGEIPGGSATNMFLTRTDNTLLFVKNNSDLISLDYLEDSDPVLLGNLASPDFQAIDFEKTSERFAVADKNGEIFLLNADNLERKIKLSQSSKNNYTKLLFSPDGSYLAGITENSIINVWNLETNSIIFSTKSGYHVPPQVAFSSDSRNLIYFLSDIKIAGFNLIDKSEIFSHKPLGDITALTISPNNLNLIAAYFDRSIKKFELLSKEPILEHKAIEEKITGIHFSDDNSALCMLSNENSIHIFSNSDSNPYKFLQLWDGGFLGMDVSPSGNFFAFESFDEKIRIFSTDDAIEYGVINDQTGTFINVMKFLKDENFLATKSENHDLKIWNVNSREIAKTLTGASVPLFEISQSNDGKTLAAAGADGNVYLWDLKSSTGATKFKAFDHSAKKIKFSPDDKKIIVVSETGLTRIFDRHSNSLIAEVKEKQNGVSITALSPSSGYLAYAGHDNYIILSELSSPINSMTANIGFSPVDAISFSGDSRLLLASSNDRSLYLIDVETGNNLGILYFFGGGEWAFITPDDEFECSPGAYDFLRFVENNVATPLSENKPFSFKEGLLRLILF
ncbi:hypothetical protein MASR2M39_07390 [Ignavibacteriales bacterium]